MKRAILLLLLFTIGSLFLSATETIIRGKIQQFDGKFIKLGTYTDFITYGKEWDEKVEIVNGSFKLTTDIEVTTQVILKIEDKETSLFLDPGKVYNIQLSYDEEANLGRAFDKFLNLKFPFPKSGETNQLIKQFNKEYQTFFDANYKKMLYNGAQKETAEFIAQQEKKLTSIQNQFVANYVKYSLANLKDINNESKTKLFEGYLKKKPILFQQKEYFNFFLQFYKNDFQDLTLKKKSIPLKKALMLENDFEKSLQEITILKNFDSAELAELYLMNGLFEVYHRKTINQESALAIFEQLSKEASTSQLQKIAANIRATLLKFKENQEFEDFALLDENKVQKSLADFKGKPIYLGFWSNSSIPSLRELKVIKVLKEKYGEKMHFVSINLDDNPNSMIATKTKYDLDWTFLHYGNDYELRERYDVRTIPTYFLIGSDGKLIQSHAPGPVEIEKTLYELTKLN